MYEDIAEQIQLATQDNSKMGMFHFQVSKNASHLTNVDGLVFCQSVGVPDSYAVEYRKMLKLADIIKQQGVTIG